MRRVTCVLIGLNNMGFIHRRVTASGWSGHVCGADEQLVTQPAHLAVSFRVSLFAASLIVSTLVHISDEIQSRWCLLPSHIAMRTKAWLLPRRGEARKCRYRLVCAASSARLGFVEERGLDGVPADSRADGTNVMLMLTAMCRVTLGQRSTFTHLGREKLLKSL